MSESRAPALPKKGVSTLLKELSAEDRAIVEKLAWEIKPEAASWQHAWYMELIVWNAYKLPGRYEDLHPCPRDDWLQPADMEAQNRHVFMFFMKFCKMDSVEDDFASQSSGNAQGKSSANSYLEQTKSRGAPQAKQPGNLQSAVAQGSATSTRSTKIGSALPGTALPIGYAQRSASLTGTPPAAQFAQPVGGSQVAQSPKRKVSDAKKDIANTSWASHLVPETLAAEGLTFHQTLAKCEPEVEIELSIAEHTLFATRPSSTELAPVERIAQRNNTRCEFIAGGKTRKWRWSGFPREVDAAVKDTLKIFRPQSRAVALARRNRQPLPLDASLVKIPNRDARMIVAYDQWIDASGRVVLSGEKNVVIPVPPEKLEVSASSEASSAPKGSGPASSAPQNPVVEPSSESSLPKDSAVESKSFASSKVGQDISATSDVKIHSESPDAKGKGKALDAASISSFSFGTDPAVSPDQNSGPKLNEVEDNSTVSDSFALETYVIGSASSKPFSSVDRHSGRPSVPDKERDLTNDGRHPESRVAHHEKKKHGGGGGRGGRGGGLGHGGGGGGFGRGDGSGAGAVSSNWRAQA